MNRVNTASRYHCCCCLVTKLCLTLCDSMDYSPWNFPGKCTGVDCHFLLQGIFLTQRSNSHLASPALADGSFTSEYHQHIPNAELSSSFFLWMPFSHVYLLSISAQQIYQLKATRMSYLSFCWSGIQEWHIAVFFAQGLTRVKSQCQPGLQFLPTEQDPLLDSLVVGRIHFLTVVELRSLISWSLLARDHFQLLVRPPLFLTTWPPLALHNIDVYFLPSHSEHFSLTPYPLAKENTLLSLGSHD